MILLLFPTSLNNPLAALLSSEETKVRVASFTCAGIVIVIPKTYISIFDVAIFVYPCNLLPLFIITLD